MPNSPHLHHKRLTSQHVVSNYDDSEVQECEWCGQRSTDDGSTALINIRKYLYHKETNLYGEVRRIMRSLIYGARSHRSGYQSKYAIDYKEALMDTQSSRASESLSYKSFDQIMLQVEPSITSLLKSPSHTNSLRMHFGDASFKIMMANQLKKKNLLKNNPKPKFKLNYQPNLPASSTEKMLQNANLSQKYDFRSINSSASPQEGSTDEILKLQRTISNMIQQIAQAKQIKGYPQISKDLHRPYIDFNKSKKQVQFRKRLENQVSSIVVTTTAADSKKRQRQSQKPKSNIRLNTSPELIDNQIICDGVFNDAYGIYHAEHHRLKKKKKLDGQKAKMQIPTTGRNKSQSKLLINGGSSSKKLKSNAGGFLNNQNNHNPSRIKTQQVQLIMFKKKQNNSSKSQNKLKISKSSSASKNINCFIKMAKSNSRTKLKSRLSDKSQNKLKSSKPQQN